MPSEATAGDLFACHGPSSSHPLHRRPRTALHFDPRAVGPDDPILLDTTVYIDALQGGLPIPMQALVASRIVLHSAVAVAEMALSAAYLRPDHPSTPQNRLAITATLDRIPLSQVLPPSPATWIEASILAGTVAQTQARDASDRRALLNDALLLLGAEEAGAVLVSRNIADIDLLLQLRPTARALLYDRA